MRIYPELLVDQEFKSLGDQGFMGTLNDRQFAFLRSKGYVNALADMMTSWLSWSPANLFSLSEPGIWLDPSDVANLDWRRNLLTYTEVITEQNGVRATLLNNQGVAPNGENTAGTVTETAVAGDHRVDFDGVSVTSGTQYTLSVYLKPNGRNWARVNFDSGEFGTAYANFNVSTGAVGATTGLSAFSVVAAGNGFYRVSTTATATTTGTASISIQLATGNNTISYTGDGTSGIYLWGAQLELGSVATDYQRISNVNTEVLERFPKTTMFQDSAGTTAVTTPGQSVGLVLDKSKGLVLGPQLVTNGTFDTDISGWTAAPAGDGVVDWNSGALRISTNSSGINTSAFQNVTTVSGTTYVLTADYSVTGDASNLNIRILDSTGITTKVTATAEAASGTGTLSLVFVADASTMRARVQVTQNNRVVSFENISVKELPGNHVAQPTAAARPRYIVDADGTFIQHDLVDDALTVTLPDMGTEATVAYVTRSEVRLLEDQTISGSYTLPKQEIAGFIAIDRALTQAEKINVIRYLASKVEGVNYGAEIDRLTLIAINAVDVFVYDTSKDSDGGAWRAGALAQASSWYNETLNTATRGSRREFPAVAVIVAEAGKVTIYDGDDPALPMWMVFNTANNLLVRATTVSSIAMQNGVLAVGSSNSGFSRLDFISEQCLVKTTAGYAFPVQSISFRNTGQSIALDGSTGLVNAFVNDVAMTVLPDAPIDPATGLPVPTIAVATAGGTSVITDSGAVYDSSSTSPKNNISFDGNRLFYTQSTSEGRWSIDVTTITADGFVPELYDESTNNGWYATNDVPVETAVNGSTLLSGSNLGFYAHVENTTTPANGMIALTTSTYNTGWMNGDIKGAFLSDTDDTDLVGGELVTNGTFDTDTSGWTPTNATLSVVSNALRITNTAAYGFATQAITTASGSLYQITFDLIGKTAASARVFIGTASNTANILSITPSVGSSTAFFVAQSGTTYVDFVSFDPDVGDYVDYDNISVKLADADRSVNNKGLIVNGTVTRTPVATGADLVAYSGFSASNYLEQPYNSALNFGTGDFCVMGWVYNGGTGSTQYLFSRGNTGGDWRGIAVTRRSSSGTQYLDLYIGGGSITTTSALPVGWTLLTVKREDGVAKVLFGNTLVASGNNTNSVGTGEGLKLGGQYGGSGSFTAGSLALWRISATAPTASQIEKIYNDERVLFQDKAQATLYGASDAVTALAHDPDTDLLHVGTSAGRSVFEGLRRVGNTTTSVSKTISASGGLIVEK